MKPRRLKITVPEEYINISANEKQEFVFNYLKQIGFSKENFRNPIGLDEHDYLNLEYYLEQLPAFDSDMSTDIKSGAFYLIHTLDNTILSEEKFHSILINIRGGLNIYYVKSNVKEKENIRLFKYEIEKWLQEVLMEPADEVDVEIRRSELRIFRMKLDTFSLEFKKGYEYIHMIRPGSPIQKQLKTLDERLIDIEHDKNIT